MAEALAQFFSKAICGGTKVGPYMWFLCRSGAHCSLLQPQSKRSLSIWSVDQDLPAPQYSHCHPQTSKTGGHKRERKKYSYQKVTRQARDTSPKQRMLLKATTYNLTTIGNQLKIYQKILMLH